MAAIQLVLQESVFELVQKVPRRVRGLLQEFQIRSPVPGQAVAG
jgi:hypothetical protein